MSVEMQTSDFAKTAVKLLADMFGDEIIFDTQLSRQKDPMWNYAAGSWIVLLDSDRLMLRLNMSEEQRTAFTDALGDLLINNTTVTPDGTPYASEEIRSMQDMFRHNFYHHPHGPTVLKVSVLRELYGKGARVTEPDRLKKLIAETLAHEVPPRPLKFPRDGTIDNDPV